jgi:hypothetical protein
MGDIVASIGGLQPSCRQRIHLQRHELQNGPRCCPP